MLNFDFFFDTFFLDFLRRKRAVLVKLIAKPIVYCSNFESPKSPLSDELVFIGSVAS